MEQIYPLQPLQSSAVGQEIPDEVTKLSPQAVFDFAIAGDENCVKVLTLQYFHKNVRNLLVVNSRRRCSFLKRPKKQVIV